MTEDYEKFGLPDYMDVVAKMESPRIIKTHLSWEMIPNQIHEKKVKVNTYCFLSSMLVSNTGAGNYFRPRATLPLSRAGFQ